jgi:hypothetical protein
MIDVSELMLDPDFMQPLSLNRYVKSFITSGDAAGEISSSFTTINNVLFSVQPTTVDDLLSLPEGERNDTSRRFYCGQELFAADNDGVTNELKFDVITYQGLKYKITKLKSWGDNGYWLGIGVQSQRIDQ